MNYKGLDDDRVTPLCPIVVTPAHEVREVPRAGSEQSFASHNSGRKTLQRVANLVHQGLRRNLLLSQAMMDALAPITLAGLLGKILFPKPQQHLVAGLSKAISPEVNTELVFTSTDNETVATPAQPKLGFTDNEQADRVAGFCAIPD